MSEQGPASDQALRFQRAFLLLLVAAISLLFLQMVRDFLLSVFLAAIFAAMSTPLYRRLRASLRGRENAAAIITLLLLLLGVVAPLATFLTFVVAESVNLSQSISAWVQSEPDRLGQLRAWAERLPLVGRFVPSNEVVLQKLGEIAGTVGPMLASKAAAFGRGTLSFFFQLFVCLYAMFFFLVDGRQILRQVLYYIPLGPDQEAQLLERFVSVTRATLKGSLLIGVIQGVLAGLAFAVAGVPAASFWGTVMVVLSIIPAVGAALVWIPAVGYLAIMGQNTAAIGLFVWCAIVVSSVDNFLRPLLVGRDARMSDLMILLSTMGGIVLFGALGFIVGPIIAALFVTVWHIYGDAFSAWLPEVPPGFLKRDFLSADDTAASDTSSSSPRASS
ncbi:MAG: AI-2E family transporter [Gemmatimonadaceae bacterium]|jgi:predicted PurR-regulated permease PerM|nr:AI-2E family transporter [Gemmatimonadaceae bacterium]